MTHPVAAGRLVSPALVERDRDLARLLAAVASPPAVVAVAGEAGVGKSRLVAELVGHPSMAGRTVLTGHCHPLHEPLPFGPVVQALAGAQRALPVRPALGAVAGSLRALLPELADRLPPAPPPLGDPAAERHRQFRGMRELLACLGPATLVLEDLHWVDRGTVDLLWFLGRELPAGLSLVLTYRRDELPGWCTLPAAGSRLPAHVAYVGLELAPLSVAGVGRQASAILRAAGGAAHGAAAHGAAEVSQCSARRLHEWTAGSPFAVEEVLQLLRERGESLAAATEAAPQVPPVLRDSLWERLGRLQPDARRIVDAAAVLGTAASEEQLVAVTGLPAARGARALADAMRHALLLEQGAARYAFRHVLARQAAYDAIPGPARRRLHAAAARVLRSLEPLPLARLAHHCRLAGRLRDWYRFAEAAADRAIELGDSPAAVRLLDEVLAGAPESPRLPAVTRARLTLKLGRAGVDGMAGLDVAPRLRGALADERLTAAVRGELRLMLGLQVFNRSSDKRAGRAEVERAVGELRSRPQLAARALSMMAYPNQTDDHVSVDLALLKRATALLPRIQDPTDRITVQINRAMVLLNVADPAAWPVIAELPAEPDQFVQLAQLLRGMINFASTSALLGYLDRAGRFLAAATELSRRGDVDLADGWLAVTRIRLDWLSGRWSGLDALIERQLTDEMSNLRIEARLVAGLLALARGEVTGAALDLRGVLAMDGPELCGPEPASAGAGLARLLVSRGEVGAAAGELDRLVGVAMAKGAWAWSTPIVATAVGLYATTGRERDARELLAAFTGWLADRDSPMGVATRTDASARLAEGTGRPGVAASRFADAERAYRELGLPYLAAQAGEAAGRCRYAAGGDGSAAVRAALAEFERLGASWDAARCRSQLRDHGVMLASRRGRRGYGGQLSPRERDVARLAAGGRTNRQIADALCLSERTVEEHVAKALRKLGVRTRRELASRPGIDTVN